jgi:hypothetical protein
MGLKELSVLERRKQSKLPGLIRSLFRMVYRRYNKYQDPQDLDSSFKSLKDDGNAAVLLLGIIRKQIKFSF